MPNGDKETPQGTLIVTGTVGLAREVATEGFVRTAWLRAMSKPDFIQQAAILTG